MRRLYIQQNHPNATVGDVIGKKEIAMQEYPFLLGTLPYKTVQAGSEFGQIPANLRATISFNIPDPTGFGSGLSYTTSLPQIAGKKINLSFSPATANDQAIIDSLFPKPHADGTPIQPSELPTSFPAYLINLKPELRVEGIVVATGASSMMGKALNFTISLSEPGVGTSQVSNAVSAGEYFGIGLDAGRIGADRIESIKKKLEVTRVKISSRDYADITKEDFVGDLLYATITLYFAQLDMADELDAARADVIRYRVPSVGLFSFLLNVKEVFGVPTSASSNAMMMDVDRIMQAVFSKDGKMDNVRRYMLTSGGTSSALEHTVPELLYFQPSKPVSGISAVKALQIANAQGIPIYRINQSNIATLFPHLQIDTAAKSDIFNAVNAGKEVMVSKSSINYYGWVGCGYIITDLKTGAGAYMISGGASGVYITMAAALIFLIGALAAAIFLTGIAALILVALLVFIGLMFLYGEMYFAFGQNRTNKFGDCISLLIIEDYIVGRATRLLPDLLEEFVDKLLNIEGALSYAECFRQLLKT